MQSKLTSGTYVVYIQRFVRTGKEVVGGKSFTRSIEISQYRVRVGNGTPPIVSLIRL